MKKWVYKFSAELTDGNKDMKGLLGGKGANLAEMCSMKLSVPPGFTVSTEACLDFYMPIKIFLKRFVNKLPKLWIGLKNSRTRNSVM